MVKVTSNFLPKDSVLSKRTPPPIAAAPAALRSKDASEKMLSAEELKKVCALFIVTLTIFF